MKHINDISAADALDEVHAGSISALMDGVLSGQDADAALTATMQPEGQERWQLYHLIGDTLRASDLAVHHNPALLAGIRAAMQQPALPLEAGQPSTGSQHEAANDGVFRWKLAAGFASVLAVAAIGWNVWSFANTDTSPSQQLAQAGPPEQSVAQVAQTQSVELAVPGAAGASSAQSPTLNSNGSEPQVLSDPQLDRLLAAHRRMAAFGGSPSAFLRNATFEEPQR